MSQAGVRARGRRSAAGRLARGVRGSAELLVHAASCIIYTELTAPDARHVPRWLERRRARARDARGRDQRGEEAHGDDDDDETEASILSAVLPRWQKRWSARDARDAAGRREALALTRREEEAKVADAADALAAEMRELEERAAGGGGRSAASRDPLWSS